MKSNNLIPFSKDANGNIIVSGRDLHDFLEIKAQFTNWFDRMIEYGFAENVDFAVFNKNVKDESAFGGVRKVKDIAMTLDMAKEISMIQRNERGKQARQYFIQVENNYRDQQAQLPQTPEEKLALTMEVASRTSKAVQSIQLDVNKLKSNMRVTGTQEKALLDAHHKSGFRALGGKNSNAYKKRKLRDKVFHAIWREFKRTFVLPRYGELPQVKFDDGMEFLKEWAPDTELRLEIKKTNGQGNLF